MELNDNKIVIYQTADGQTVIDVKWFFFILGASNLFIFL